MGVLPMSWVESDLMPAIAGLATAVPRPLFALAALRTSRWQCAGALVEARQLPRLAVGACVPLGWSVLHR